MKADENEKKVAVVTGGSSGIGLCTAEALRDAGYTVYSLSRRENPRDGIVFVPVDVTNDASVEDAVSRIKNDAGAIDILINCAGYGISGAVEFTETSDAIRQFDVNFFGMVRMNKAILPLMREQGHGRIVNISSVAAPAAIPFQTYYSASKAAINSYTCALANEVRPFGITVTAIQPGDIRTGFTAARNKSTVGDEIYGGRISRSVATMEHDEQNGMKPEVAGAYIAKIARKEHVKPLYAIGFSYKCVCVLCNLLPCGLRNRLIGLLYAQ